MSYDRRKDLGWTENKQKKKTIRYDEFDLIARKLECPRECLASLPYRGGLAQEGRVGLKSRAKTFLPLIQAEKLNSNGIF